jgi:hypothetical protein
LWSGPLDFMKIDVDGYDTEVIRGGMNVLRATKPVILAEFCDPVLKAHGSSCVELAQTFIDCGYKYCTIIESGEKTTLHTFAASKLSSDMISRNLLLFHENS